MDKRPLSQMAGILCNDVAFQRFVAVQLALPCNRASATAAAQYLRKQCRIASRRELDNCTTAARRFAALRTDFDAFTGKIAAPRGSL